jgi:hypothetical protein
MPNPIIPTNIIGLILGAIMFSSVTLRDDLTLAAYGYTSHDLASGSHRFVVAECAACHTIVRKEYRNVGRKHSCPVVVGDQKHCYKCQQWKDLSQYNQNNGKTSKLCKACYNTHPAIKKYERQRRRRLRLAASEGDYRFYISRRGARMLSGWRSAGIPYDVTVADLITLWEQQNGLCYYTNQPMIGSGTDKGRAVWNSPSLDRLIPSIGYKHGNIVWCLWSVNSFKGELTEAEFEALTNSITWRWVGRTHCRQPNNSAG